MRPGWSDEAALPGKLRRRARLADAGDTVSLPPESGSGRRARVLVVDDNSDLAGIWAMGLNGRGYETLTASSVREALSLLSQYPCDVVLLDLGLPDRSGIALLAEMESVCPDADCVIITGHASIDSAVAALNAGAYSYLIKPVPTETLFVTVDHAVAIRQLTAENERMRRREHRVAETLQRNLMPRVPAVVSGLECAALYQPAWDEATIGGDFYDVIPLDERRLGVVIGDFSGKGLAAARHTGVARAAVRLCAFEEPTPSVVLQRVNRFLYRETSSEGFTTLFYGVIDREARRITGTNAGNDAVLLWDAQQQEVVPLRAGGPVVGAIADAHYHEEQYPWGPGSALLLCTDGATEARPAEDGDCFLGWEGVAALFRRHVGAGSAQVLVQAVHEGILSFCAGRLEDDLALLAVRALSEG